MKGEYDYRGMVSFSLVSRVVERNVAEKLTEYEMQASGGKKDSITKSCRETEGTRNERASRQDTSRYVVACNISKWVIPRS